MEAWNRFLDVRFDPVAQVWEYHVWPKRVIQRRHDPSVIPWSPAILTPSQFNLVNLLCARGEVNLDALPQGFLDRTAFDRDLTALEATGLVGRDVSNPALLSLLTTLCRTVILPDRRLRGCHKINVP